MLRRRGVRRRFGPRGPPRPARARDRRGARSRGESTPLEDRWASGPAVVVFLRHFACLACSEHVAQLAPRLRELTRLGITVVYVGNGATHFMRSFVERNAIDPEQVELVTDPTLAVHDALHLHRSFASSYGPSALLSLARAFLGGFRQTSIDGDGLQQGGIVVVERDGNVAYVHRDRFTGDHAPVGDVIDAAMRVAADRSSIVQNASDKSPWGWKVGGGVTASRDLSDAF